MNFLELFLGGRACLLAQAVGNVVQPDSTGTSIAVWGSLISGIGIAGGAIIGAWFSGASKLRDSDQKVMINDLTRENARLKEDVEDYKSRWKQVEAEFAAYRREARP